MVHALFTLTLDILALIWFDDFRDPDSNSAFRVVAIIMIVYTSTIVCCVGGLSCYHTGLAVRGATTNEELRGKFGKGGNPYNEGCSRNCRAFCYGGTSRIFAEQYNE